MRIATPFLFAAGASLVVLLEGLALASWQGWLPRRAPVERPHLPLPQPVRFGVAVPETLPPLSLPPIASPDRPQDAYYRRLRAQLRWVPTRLHGQVLLTPDPPSRMLLAKSAARRARLHEVGLGYADVYGIISAETSWVPRDGASRDGTPNLGIAQFEPATAAGLGVRDPHDVVEAVHAAAEHMRTAALWSAARIASLRLDRQERAARLREGVSIYYNLSVRGREQWDGRNLARLPAATQAHIRNARRGADEAVALEAQGRATARRGGADEAVLTATAEVGLEPAP